MADTYSTEGPECPYCGRQYTADESGYFDENGYTEETCDDCGETFDVSVCLSTSWTCSARDSGGDGFEWQGGAPGFPDAVWQGQRSDSDRSGEADKTHSGLAEGESADPKGIAQPLSTPSNGEPA